MLVELLSLACSGAWYTCQLMGLLHAVLPGWLEAAGAAAALFYGTRLRGAAPEDAVAVFGAERAPRCIAHRGALLDAPENTLAAFQYCAEQSCDFVEFDVRSCVDGQLVLMHDEDARRLTGSAGPPVAVTNWDVLSRLDVAATHPNRDVFSTGPEDGARSGDSACYESTFIEPNWETLVMLDDAYYDRERFQSVRVCTLDEALDFLTERDMRMIIDVKGDDKAVITGVLKAFSSRPLLYSRAAVTAFNPLVLYRIRSRDPRIVGAISYRPYCFSHDAYDAETGPAQPRYGGGSIMHGAARLADGAHALLWRAAAHWCRVSAVLLHKDICSPSEVAYWRSRGVRTIGWSVNRPLEKLYWRGVLSAPYLANTLVGEPPQESKTSVMFPRPELEVARPSAGSVVDDLLAQRKGK